MKNSCSKQLGAKEYKALVNLHKPWMVKTLFMVTTFPKHENPASIWSDALSKWIKWSFFSFPTPPISSPFIILNSINQINLNLIFQI